ncbi:MAG TPA: imidazoleglycerol-phosphate dehydratase HisB [Terriglobales bacterium]|nr:imidazoleglycerol-phosphate dehydratase HisB [Terriglobales bacterium]
MKPTSPRLARLQRRTRETAITLRLRLDGQGRAQVASGIGFLDHMLTALALHAAVDLDLRCQGDLEVDQHHSVEDIGIALGEAFLAALGDRRGIRRSGFCLMPMDETLALAAVDFCGRTCPVVRLQVKAARVGDLQTELVDDFFEGFARGAKANLHVRVLYGRSSHHKIEAAFKALARALRAACEPDPRLGGQIPSTKGML